MPYFDMHVKFKASKDTLAGLGFAGGAIAGEQIEEKLVKGSGDMNASPSKDKISVLSGEDAELLRKGVKRYDLIFVSSFYPDTALMREVADNDCAFEIPVSGLLRSYGYSRAALLGRMQFFLELCVKYNANYVFTSRAENQFELKSIDDFTAIGNALGLEARQVKRSMGEIAERILKGVD
jgi:RNase P/RNase MRP subunit p30